MATPLLYVSFHGGSKSKYWNNIHVFTLEGEEATPSKALNKSSLPDHVDLQELRDFIFGPDGNLYVVNAYKKYSQILRFKGEPNGEGQFDFDEVFTGYDEQSNPAFVHPFQMAFDQNDNLLASCQDSNTVVAVYGPGATAGDPGAPMPVASAYSTNCSDCPVGTFVPSSSFYSGSGALNMVRGITFDTDGNLLVADENNNSVALYDGTTGAYIKNIVDVSNFPALDEPVHVLAHKNILYVGNKNGNNILSIDLSKDNAPVNVFIANKTGAITSPSGMCFYETNNAIKFLLGDRDGKKIIQYSVTGNTATFDKLLLSDLDDSPEFLRIFSLG
ncbi:MAG: hypothetical protein AAFZ15_06490 [Bacteroidota bacterium]